MIYCVIFAKNWTQKLRKFNINKNYVQKLYLECRVYLF